jgi:hypothetical protein
VVQIALKMEKTKHNIKRTKTRSSSAAGPRSVNIDFVKKNVDFSISQLLTLAELFF